jgi:hypothetical protein
VKAVHRGEAVKNDVAKDPSFRRRSDFFTVMACVLLLLVVLGFVPTLYARPLFAVPPIPAYLYVHGLVLSAWFVWFVAQAVLIRTGSVASHRRFGVGGACFAGVVVAASLMATLGAVSRVDARGFDLSQDASVLGIGVTGVTLASFLSGVVWGNIANVVSFSSLLLAGVAYRRRPDTHKRLMLLASLSIIGPALARIARWPVFGGEQGSFTPIVIWGLLLLLAGHDLWARKRLHPATLIGALVLVLFNYGGRVAAGSAAGLTLIYALR